jgi:nitroreductase
MIRKLKKYGRLITSGLGFIYDYSRFIKFSGWGNDLGDHMVRGYHIVKIYHALEKSMSYTNRDPKHGWSSAFLLLDVLKKSSHLNSFIFNELVGAEVLLKFINLPENRNTDKAREIRRELSAIPFQENKNGGVMEYGRSALYRGKINKPEDFFLSRFSLREFKNESIDIHTVMRAISLAVKAPSVCNRQPWHIYHTDKREVIDRALALQSGNRGFGHLIPNLAVITTDLKAFMPGNEHYQHWIEGGIISMSLIHAFHSLGVASCCLNWSQSPGNDKKLRKILAIEDSHTVIMMLAYGLPCKTNKVCVSDRRPVEEYQTELELK